MHSPGAVHVDETVYGRRGEHASARLRGCLSETSYRPLRDSVRCDHASVEQKLVAVRVVASDVCEFAHAASSLLARDVHDQLNRQRNGLPDAAMGQPDVGGQDAVREPRQRLLRGVRVNGAQAAQVAGVERLQQVERSPPRTSPSRIRSGRCRNVARSRSVMVTAGSGVSWPRGACARRASKRSRFGLSDGSRPCPR